PPPTRPVKPPPSADQGAQTELVTATRLRRIAIAAAAVIATAGGVGAAVVLARPTAPPVARSEQAKSAPARAPAPAPASVPARTPPPTPTPPRACPGPRPGARARAPPGHPGARPAAGGPADRGVRACARHRGHQRQGDGPHAAACTLAAAGRLLDHAQRARAG